MRASNGITWDGRLMFRYRIALWQDGATYSISYKGEEVLSIDVEGTCIIYEAVSPHRIEGPY